MANERLILAIGHMERALTRLETAQAQFPQNEETGKDKDVAELMQRHARLKTAAAEALAGIDAMLTGNR